MKERGILFSAPMVKALLASTKTQTRRLVKQALAAELTRDGWPNVSPLAIAYVAERCPYGTPGDRLWVRETWYDDMEGELTETRELREDGRIEGIEYRASHDCAAWEAGCPCNPDGDGKRSEWRPSIYMPRWASRITLEVTEVRVQRLQDISEEDAKAEGVTLQGEDDCWSGSYRSAFEFLWGEINGWEGQPGARAPWNTNPWLWCVTFRRVP